MSRGKRAFDTEKFTGEDYLEFERNQNRKRHLINLIVI